jgi:hypothetical protein
MTSSIIIKLWLIGIMVITTSLLMTQAVSAHGGREVGPYEFNVGFMDEPAYEGRLNGVDLRIELAESGTPVEGVHKSLQVEVTHISSEGSKTLELQPVKGEPGRYTADLIPTAPGEFRFRFFGTIEDMAIDEAFESGPDHFAAIESSAALQIPHQLPEMREVGAAARGSMDTAVQAQDGAATATGLAIAGLLLGAIGAVAGVGALVMTRKRDKTQPTRTGLPTAEKPSTAG